MPRTKTTEQFIEEATKVHDGTYDYSKVLYVRGQEKVIIICSNHGEFPQTPDNHLRGQGCPKCYRESKPGKPSTNKGGYTENFFIQCSNMKSHPAMFYIVEITTGSNHFINGVTLLSQQKIKS